MFKVCASLAIFCSVCLQVTYAQFEPSDGRGSVATDGQSVGFFKSDEVFFNVQSTGVQKHSLSSCPPPNPIRGPQDFYAYTNNRGDWKLPPISQLSTPMSGSAEYTWFDGSRHHDKLTYIAHGHVTDQGGGGVPRGTKVSVWTLMATDTAGNSMFFYLATDPIIKGPLGRRYPMYYSWDIPGPNTVIKRFITLTGTKRL